MNKNKDLNTTIFVLIWFVIMGLIATALNGNL